VIDGAGKYVTPGIIDTHSHVGAGGAPGGSGTLTNDVNEATNPVTAQVWVEHSVWPQDAQFPRTLAGGVTTIQVLPGSANLIGGPSVTLKVVPSRSVQGMKFPAPSTASRWRAARTPKRVYAQRGPSTRMGNVAGYRRAWIQADGLPPPVGRVPRRQPPGRPARARPRPGDARRGAARQHPRAQPLLPRRRDDADDRRRARVRLPDPLVPPRRRGVQDRRRARARLDLGSLWADWGGFKLEAVDGIRANIALVHAAGARAIVHSDDASASSGCTRRPRRRSPRAAPRGSASPRTTRSAGSP
jgi:hypothetical protein